MIGGGPAGLYFAILMKRQDPSREIIVAERDAPDDTFDLGPGRTRQQGDQGAGPGRIARRTDVGQVAFVEGAK